jgi:hypothetical protein
MRAATWLSGMASLGLLACTGSGKTTNPAGSAVSKAVAEALTTGIAFEHGLLKQGAIPDPTATKVDLTPDTETLMLKPGGGELMSLEVDNPDEATDAVQALLVQFEADDRHIEVPRGTPDAGTPSGDAGANGRVTLEGSFTVDPGVCKNLCNQTTQVKMFLAAMLHKGGVSKHQMRSFELDCRDDGDATKCPKAADTGSKSDAGKTGAAGSAADAGTAKAGATLQAGYLTFDRAVCGCSTAADKTMTFCAVAPFSSAATACVQTTIDDPKNSASLPIASCYDRVIRALATSCKSGCTCDVAMLNAQLASMCGALPALDACGLGSGAADGGAVDAGAKP